MVSAVELVEELESRGGLLGILKSYYSKLEDLAKKATSLWRKAFPSSRVSIAVSDIGRFYGLLKGIYKRSRGDRKKQLANILKEYDIIYKEYKKLTLGIDLSIIRRFIEEGERVYNLPKVYPHVFLYNLHNWIAKLYLYFMTRRNYAEHAIPTLYKFLDKMVYLLIDVSTEYTGESRNPASFEFILAAFIHIENMVHESNEYYEPYGIVPVAVVHLLDLLEYLAEQYDYIVVFPGYHVGMWSDEYYIEPFTRSSGLEADRIVNSAILSMASQIGIDVKNNIAILEYLEQKFPAYFLIYDHHRGVVRREARAQLPWDFLKLDTPDIARMFK